MNTNTFPRTHISLYVSDLAKTIEFYNAFFGKKADKIKPGYAKYIIESPSLIISFIENPERVQTGFGHLGFQVATRAAVESLLEKAKAKQIVSSEETGTACCYAIQDKFWVSDPDGVRWEVYYFHKDTEVNDPHYQSPESNSCCASSSAMQQ
ncbi:MAG: VOC family protein, partial [Sinomicrobium sp.]|nr:VOC family protein [Sinomicrobium sp.]